jgi:hypothetical protein
MPDENGNPTEAEITARLNELRQQLDALILKWNTEVLPNLSWRKRLELMIWGIGRTIADGCRMTLDMAPGEPFPEVPTSPWW